MFGKFLLSFAGLALCGASTFAFVQGRGGDHPRLGRFMDRHPRLREMVEHRRDALRHRVAEKLGITDAQREQLRTQAENVRPIAEQFRAEAREILRNARDSKASGDRGAVREQTRADLKALFERYFPQLEPNARSLVDALTPVQRAKLEQHAAKRGRTLDDERMKHAAAFLMLRRSRGDATSAR